MKTTQTFREGPTLVIVFLTLTCVVGSVHAATVYQQPLANNLEGAFSNQGGQEIADTVSVAIPISVTHITWYGFYDIDLNPAVTSLGFNVSFLPDSSGAPGAVPLFSQAFNAGVQSTGQTVNTPGLRFDGSLIYRFDVDLPSAITITAGVTDWLSIIDRDPSTTQWVWARSSFDPNLSAYGVGGSWTTTTTSGQFAFAFDGAVVPEPPVWALLLVGFTSMCCVHTLRKKRATRVGHEHAA